jgi:hypothetical protein
MADETELKVGGFTFKGVYLAAALPLLGSLSGGIYYGYDVVNRFWGVEESVNEVLSATSRIQALEQTIGENNVAGLNTQLSQISTQMVSILEQQKTLLDLRSKVERAELITNEYDLNGNGVIDPEEREIMLEDRRRKMEDADAKRDAQRRMAWFSLTGMLVFPFGVVFAEWMGLPQASQMLSSMSNIYYVSIAAIVGAYYGFTNMGKCQ